MAWRNLDKSHPDYYSMKEAMKEEAWRTLVADGQYGVPQRCPCGERIFHEISEIEGDLGNRYFTCEKYKNDGFHWRIPWFGAVDEEFARLRKEVDDQAKKLRILSSLEFQVKQMRDELQNQREKMAKLNETVSE
uniref:Uncharacterized protein n=1 Tax=Noccaea caerulescens TaxID=107243 RepID=A0A1J3CWX1_NOCCA